MWRFFIPAFSPFYWGQAISTGVSAAASLLSAQRASDAQASANSTNTAPPPVS